MTPKQRRRLQRALKLENEKQEMIEAQQYFEEQSLAVDRIIAKFTGEMPTTGAISQGEKMRIIGFGEEPPSAKNPEEAGSMVEPKGEQAKQAAKEGGQLLTEAAASPLQQATEVVELKPIGLVESIEITSGRLCMMAFVLALMIEAFTGYGFVGVWGLFFRETRGPENFFDIYGY